MNKKIVLKKHSLGKVSVDNFDLVTSPIDSLQDHQVLVQVNWLSLDPYVKGRISQSKSYANNVAIGEVIMGESIGTVIQSNSTKFNAGDRVIGMTGWQTNAVMDDSKLHALLDANIPVTYYLGAAGMPGITAWIGVNHICKPKLSDVFLVNAATGAVGSIAGQLAKKLGCHVIGIASTPEKCQYAIEKLGFDQCLSHQAPNFKDELANNTSKGIDCFFDNVGGDLFDAVLPHMNIHGRIAICGLIGENDFQHSHSIQLRQILNKRLQLKAFIAYDYLNEWKPIQSELISQIKDTNLIYRESITNGIENAPKAFTEMLNGKNFGKTLIKLF